MYSLVISLALLGQAEIGVPPAPAAEVTVTSPQATPTTAEEMRSWLLARLVIDSAFDEKKSAEAQRLLSTMNLQQLTALVAAYKEKPVKALPSRQALDAAQQQALDQAKLNQQQAEAYRDHLKREYDRRLLQGQMTQNLVYQNIVNNQMMMFRGNGPFTYGAYAVGPYGYGGLSYGGLGYGIMNYGGWGYGAPVYGGGFYGVPGVW